MTVETTKERSVDKTPKVLLDAIHTSQLNGFSGSDDLLYYGGVTVVSPPEDLNELSDMVDQTELPRFIEELVKCDQKAPHATGKLEIITTIDADSDDWIFLWRFPFEAAGRAEEEGAVLDRRRMKIKRKKGKPKPHTTMEVITFDGWVLADKEGTQMVPREQSPTGQPEVAITRVRVYYSVGGNFIAGLDFGAGPMKTMAQSKATTLAELEEHFLERLGDMDFVSVGTAREAFSEARRIAGDDTPRPKETVDVVGHVGPKGAA